MITRGRLRHVLELTSIYENALVNIATNASKTYPLTDKELMNIASNALLQKKKLIPEVNENVKKY